MKTFVNIYVILFLIDGIVFLERDILASGAVVVGRREI